MMKFCKISRCKSSIDAVNAELHDVEIGTRIEKIEMAFRTRRPSERSFKEGMLLILKDTLSQPTIWEIETISKCGLRIGNRWLCNFQRYIPEYNLF